MPTVDFEGNSYNVDEDGLLACTRMFCSEDTLEEAKCLE